MRVGGALWKMGGGGGMVLLGAHPPGPLREEDTIPLDFPKRILR